MERTHRNFQNGRNCRTINGNAQHKSVRIIAKVVCKRRAGIINALFRTARLTFMNMPERAIGKAVKNASVYHFRRSDKTAFRRTDRAFCRKKMRAKNGRNSRIRLVMSLKNAAQGIFVLFLLSPKQLFVIGRN